MLLAEALASRQLTPLVRVSALADAGFLEWLQTPEYQVDVSTGNAELLVADADKCLAHVANDVSRLLKAGRETSEIIMNGGSHATKSPAWLAIQAYYAAFYYVSAYQKLVANNLTYARTSDLAYLRSEIQTLNPQPPIAIRTGQWNFRFAPNGSRITVEKPANADGVHETTWKEFRRLLDELIAWVPTSPLSDQERAEVTADLGALKRLTEGVAGLPFLSSSRNDIQYRQTLDCWSPISKQNKALNFEDIAKLGWADSLAFDSVDASSKTDLECFMRRALTVCGAIHRTVLLIGDQYGNTFLSRAYGKYHNSLLPKAA